MNISCSLLVNSSISNVFQWISDPRKAQKWQPNIAEYQITDMTENLIGTKFREVIEEGSGTLEMFGEVVSVVENKEIAFRLTSRVHELDVVYELSDSSGPVKVTVTANVRWKLPISILVFIRSRVVQRELVSQMEVELRRLKVLCETEIA